MSGGHHRDQDKESTLYVGNLDERVTDKIIWELMTQGGPVVNVHLPRDRVLQTHQGFGFVEMGSEADAEYTANIMNGTKLWGKPIRVNKANADKRISNEANGGGSAGVGAELWVSGLDPMVTEKMLYDLFIRFGNLVSAPKLGYDATTGQPKGHAFISFDSFEAADAAIESLNGTYYYSKDLQVQYAFKKDGKGERHGDAAERALAAQAKANGVQVPVNPLPVQLTHSIPPSGPANPNFRPTPPPGYHNPYAYPPPPGGMYSPANHPNPLYMGNRTAPPPGLPPNPLNLAAMQANYPPYGQGQMPAPPGFAPGPQQPHHFPGQQQQYQAPPGYPPSVPRPYA